MLEFRICHLYPDVLNLYGDRGNLRVCAHRLRARGIAVTVEECPIGHALDLARCDLLFLGGGQDFEQQVLLHDLVGDKSRTLCAAIEQGYPVLAICGGYQLLGQYYKTWDGVQLDFIGALDLYTVGARERMIGNYLFEVPPESGGTQVVGFENHAGKTYLGADVQPLGTVLTGFGNNGEDKTEGARYRNVFATYSHGPLLPKNPVLCDHILRTALEYKYGDAAPALCPLDDTLELAAHRAMQQRLQR